MYKIDLARLARELATALENEALDNERQEVLLNQPELAKSQLKAVVNREGERINVITVYPLRDR